MLGTNYDQKPSQTKRNMLVIMVMFEAKWCHQISMRQVFWSADSGTVSRVAYV
jgi:hypothetical protein